MRLLAGIALASLVTGGCGGDGPTGPSAGNVRYINVGPYPRVVLPSTVPLRIEVAVSDSGGEPLPLPPRDAFTWTSSDPAVANISSDGVVRVSASAPQGARTAIRVSYGTAEGYLEVYAALPPIGARVVPERTITPGAQLLLYARAVNPQGLDEEGHVGEFSLATGATNVRLTRVGCATDEVNCVSYAPDLAWLYADAPGQATVEAVVDGQVGVGTITVRTVSFASVTAGGGHTCGAGIDGAFFCWGGGHLETPEQVVLPGLTDVQAGANQTCGLDADGFAYCWMPQSDAVPELVSSTIRFTRLASGSESSCGLDLGGMAWCWGANGWGQLGDGTKNPSLVPVAVAGSHTFADISTYGDHACALTDAGAVYCWGSNVSGELGNTAIIDGCGNYACSTTPVRAAAGQTFVQIVTGQYFSCGRTSEGPGWCWGNRYDLGAGDPPAAPGAPGPVQIGGGQPFTALTAGYNHACGLTPAGAALCWGHNSAGQTGQATSELTASPTAVPGGRTFFALEAGGAHTCGLADSGLYCWGANGTGQLGVPIPQPGMGPMRVTGQP